MSKTIYVVAFFYDDDTPQFDRTFRTVRTAKTFIRRVVNSTKNDISSGQVIKLATNNFISDPHHIVWSYPSGE